MTSLVPGPSPRSNPFARPKPNHASSFSRTSILPTVSTLPTAEAGVNGVSTPAEKNRIIAAVGSGSVGRGTGARNAWRLLYRGGLEIGPDGWRLDGITFFARLSFAPPTPSQQTPNPFDVPLTNPSPNPTSPFPIPGGDTDLCLSLESMRGRKYLQVRGLVDLGEDEVLEGEDSDNSGVQMSIAPTAPLLAAYFTSLLCRHPALSPSGRTLSAVVIGLGDEGIDSTGSSVLIYGQRASSEDGPTTLKLCVGRKRVQPPPPSEKKVRPGEPLPRPKLFFPAKAPKKPPPPFPRRSGSGSTLSRAQSVSSIYHPPPPPAPAQARLPQPLPPAPVSGRTPGRRGEKRPRPMGEDDERRRKSGKIVVTANNSLSELNVPTGASHPGSSSANTALRVERKEDEDIFGKRANSIAPLPQQSKGDRGDEGETTAKKRRVPHQVLDNKATVRKQTMVMLEERGYARDHHLFKEVFGMTTKGAYFAFRDVLESGPLRKVDIQRIIRGHLEMYLPLPGRYTDPNAADNIFEDLFDGNGNGDGGQVRRGEGSESVEHGLSSDAPLGATSEGAESEGMILSETDFEIKDEVE